MFEITYDGEEIFDYHREYGRVHPKGEYEFTFENRFLIFKQPNKNRFEYIAFDMKTNRTSRIEERSADELYSDLTHEAMIPKILYSIKYTGDTRYADYLSANPKQIIDSIFRDVLPRYGYAVREEQIQLAKSIYEGFTQNRVTICEAEVGTGKTFAYLVAGYVAKRHNDKDYLKHLPLTITTSSIELQKSLVEVEIPKLSRMLMEQRYISKPLTAVVRKGRDHYFCEHRFEDFLEKIKKHPIKYKQAIVLLENIGKLKYGIDLDNYRIHSTVKNRICIKGTCRGCKRRNDCRYELYCNQMYSNSDLDFQVTNHNLYLMAKKEYADGYAPMLRNSCFVVVDEAHKFKETAEDIFGESISETDVERFIRNAKFAYTDKEHKSQYRKKLDALRKINTTLFDMLRTIIDKDDFDEEQNKIISLTEIQRNVIDQFVEAIENIEKEKITQKFAIPINSSMLKKALKTIRKDSKNILWLEQDENGILSLHCTPKNIGEVLYKKLWKHDIGHVLTSGTMSDGTDFEYFKEELGIAQLPKPLISETMFKSPFDYQTNSRLYIPDDMPFPDNDNDMYIESVANRIESLVSATHGHTAILFTSYKVLNKVYELLEHRLDGYDVIKMDKGNRTSISDFKKANNGVLFAAGPMWEGVDCVGDCLSSVIIVKMPFPIRTALMEQRKNECDTTFEFIDKYCVPKMLMKLRQGVGRLIRCETDTGVVSILDSRVHNNLYSEKISKAFEKYPVITSIDEVARFITEIKAESY